MTDIWHEAYLFDIGNAEPRRLIFLFSPARRMMVLYMGLALWAHKWEHECRGTTPRHDDH